MQHTGKGKDIPAAILDYIEGLKSHDIGRIAASFAEDLCFVSATRMLDKVQFLKMLAAL